MVKYGLVTDCCYQKLLLAVSMISFKIYGANEISREAIIVIIKMIICAVLCFFKKYQIKVGSDLGIIIGVPEAIDLL
jgi:hypothetical protein